VEPSNRPPLCRRTGYRITGQWEAEPRTLHLVHRPRFVITEDRRVVKHPQGGGARNTDIFEAVEACDAPLTVLKIPYVNRPDHSQDSFPLRVDHCIHTNPRSRPNGIAVLSRTAIHEPDPPDRSIPTLARS
jgi:hypothetical protein